MKSEHLASKGAGGETPKGRGRLRQSFRRPALRYGGHGGATRPPYMLLRNEPISFSRIYHCITYIHKNLCRLHRRLQMDSFWKNEPILGRVLGPLIVNMAILRANYQLRTSNSQWEVKRKCRGCGTLTVWRWCWK